jgi:dipeptidyl aminopeptidase/acylaminoacyl peptidase
MTGTPWTTLDLYNKWNPAAHADKWSTPTLVIHGGMDFRLPVTEGLSAFTALQRRNIPSKLLIFPMENHWVLKPQNR